MLARVAPGKVKPGAWEEYKRAYREEILPASRGVKGLRFREPLRGTDDPNEGISPTVWGESRGPGSVRAARRIRASWKG
jgi:heme-degrading monooxygenase HmoA